MGDWSNPRTRITSIEIRRGAAENAEGFPGPVTPSTDQHIGVGYEIVLPSGRIVHQSGLTIHGPAGMRVLPAELAAAVDALWAHAEQVAAQHEGLKPA